MEILPNPIKNQVAFLIDNTIRGLIYWQKFPNGSYKVISAEMRPDAKREIFFIFDPASDKLIAKQAGGLVDVTEAFRPSDILDLKKAIIKQPA